MLLPAILIRPCACPLEHLGTLLDPDDRAFGANPAFQSRKAQTGTAANVQNPIAFFQTQQLDRAMPHGFEQQELEIVDARARPILA